ncbi:hypothetical protein [Paraburkholderia bryophila]|uniref:Uncharacterized protein n=1 Tax=Paraburkholderia bryophila TaxID=420952 RepID=A0A7Y9WK12_9BURK|nr:hypothetical protein [Paraburkholderia bryophila]NYH22345.1 hypothetical protein [Paraburkholderia bryophila]
MSSTSMNVAMETITAISQGLYDPAADLGSDACVTAMVIAP